MQFTRLGHTGLTVSRICLGMMTYGTPQWRPWVLDEAASRPWCGTRWSSASTTSTPPTCTPAARASAHRPLPARVLQRDEVVIATKVFYPSTSRSRAARSRRARRASSGRTAAACRASASSTPIDASLQRLGTDYVDLYQIHRWDPATPIEETMEALHDVVKAGKARYIGAQLDVGVAVREGAAGRARNGWTRFVSMQNHYNLAYREEEREMMPLCRDQGVALVPVEPARARLPGRQPAAGDGKGGATSRAQTDDIAQNYYYRASDFATVARSGRWPPPRACPTRRWPTPGCCTRASRRRLSSEPATAELSGPGRGM
jgi:aryl-alcohol dehydrogenase (NADP+)